MRRPRLCQAAGLSSFDTPHHAKPSIVRRVLVSPENDWAGDDAGAGVAAYSFVLPYSIPLGPEPVGFTSATTACCTSDQLCEG